MTANLGEHFEDNHLTPAIFNAKSVLADLGTNLASLAVDAQYGLLNCIETGGGFETGVVYVPIYDTQDMTITEFRPVFKTHLHNSINSQDGGPVLDIYHANSGFGQVEFIPSPEIADFEKFGSGTFTIDRTSGSSDRRLSMNSTAVSSTNVSVQRGGPKVMFDANVELQTRIQNSHNSDLALRIGINCDRLDQAQSSSRRQIFAEGCDGHGTDYVIGTANGNTASLSITQTTIDLAEPVFTMTNFLKPGLEHRIYKDGVSEAASDSTSCPSDGSSDAARYLTYSIQTNVSQSRILEFWWYRIAARFLNMYSVFT